MFKGFIPVPLYAKLMGIKLNTAYQQARRRKIRSIVTEDGQRFIYYEEKPDGELADFMSCNEYCKRNSITRGAIERRIKKGLIDEKYIRRLAAGKIRSHLYIHKDYVWKKDPLRPDGYLMLSEWAKKNHFSISNACHYIKIGRLDCVRANGHTYIKEDAVASVKRRTMNSKPRPDGYLSIGEWAKANELSYQVVWTHVRDGKIPCIRTGWNIYISPDVKCSDVKRRRKLKTTIKEGELI